MALTHTTAEHKEHIDYLYQTYGTGTFQFNDIKHRIPKSIFKQFCDNTFLVKSGASEYKTTSPNHYGCKKILATNWKLNMYFIRKYVE